MKRKVFFIIIAFIISSFIWFFIAYLRNINTEVLDAFGTMNDRFEQNNQSVQISLDSLKQEVSYTDYAGKLIVMDSLSKNLHSHIEYIKDVLVQKLKDPSNFSEMDNSAESDVFFFKNDGHSLEGQKFLSKIEDYKNGMNNLFQEDFPEIIKSIDDKFNLRDDIKDWLDYNFRGFPLVATITKLTSMQSDIHQIKQDVLVGILSD